MSDYGHDIEFGYFLTPDAGDPQGVLDTGVDGEAVAAAATDFSCGVAGTPLRPGREATGPLGHTSDVAGLRQ